MSLDKLHESITDLIPKLLSTMDAFEQAQRNLHPSRFQQLAEFVAPFEKDLQLAFDHFEALEFPDDLKHFQEMIASSATYCLRACDGIKKMRKDSAVSCRRCGPIAARRRLYIHWRQYFRLSTSIFLNDLHEKILSYCNNWRKGQRKLKTERLVF